MLIKVASKGHSKTVKVRTSSHHTNTILTLAMLSITWPNTRNVKQKVRRVLLPCKLNIPIDALS